MSPLKSAIKINSVKTLSLLLEKIEFYGKTKEIVSNDLCHYTARNGSFESFSLLFKYISNTNCVDKDLFEFLILFMFF